jgi:hypothetical protein
MAFGSGSRFTGVAAAAGDGGAEVTIEVVGVSGEVVGTADFSVPPNCQIARLMREWVPEAKGRLSGYIRLNSNEPLWAWEPVGDGNFLVSGPPL